MAIEVNRIFGFNVHSLTIRRWLSKFWRRASPTLHIKDPDKDKEAKLARIKEALARCDADNPVFYEDEVDIHSPQKNWGRLDAKRSTKESGDIGILSLRSAAC